MIIQLILTLSLLTLIYYGFYQLIMGPKKKEEQKRQERERQLKNKQLEEQYRLEQVRKRQQAQREAALEAERKHQEELKAAETKKDLSERVEIPVSPVGKSPIFRLSIETPSFTQNDDEPQNLDFYRDKLNSRKALKGFNTYVVLDCETTGLSPKIDEIIEIALIKYVNGELTDTLSSLVAPSRPIPSRITEITGITNADLVGAPPIDEIIPKVWNFVSGFTLVGHNIPFDIGFLKTQFAKHGYEGHFNYVDTLQLARFAFPNFPNHKLSTCIEKLSLSTGQTHRAMDDVVCTQQLLEKCLPILLEKKEQELAERRARRASATSEKAK